MQTECGNALTLQPLCQFHGKECIGGFALPVRQPCGIILEAPFHHRWELTQVGFLILRHIELFLVEVDVAPADWARIVSEAGHIHNPSY